MRRHRLAERLLLDVIGLEWEKVHREADRWEHAISADVEEKLVELLGDPMTCPHGNPIPGTKRNARDRGRRSRLRRRRARARSRSPASARSSSSTTPGLHLVATARLIPGATAEVVGRAPDGVQVRTPAGEHTVPDDVAEQMYVSAA